MNAAALHSWPALKRPGHGRSVPLPADGYREIANVVDAAKRLGVTAETLPAVEAAV